MSLSPIEELQVLLAMDSEVTNIYSTGKGCRGCGQCCSRVIPISNTERFIIKAEAKKKGIKPRDYVKGRLNMICPFLSDKRECMIYEHRPAICREFRCDKTKEEVMYNMASEHYKLCDLNELIRDRKSKNGGRNGR